MARLSLLIVLSILSVTAKAEVPITPIEYSQDWEAGDLEVLTGWLGYINVFDADCETLFMVMSTRRWARRSESSQTELTLEYSTSTMITTVRPGGFLKPTAWKLTFTGK